MNIRQIAQIAGVSTATVSRALKNSPSVSPEKKRHILDIAQNLNYYPDKNKPGSKTQKTFGLLVPSEEKKLIYQNANFFSGVFMGLKEVVDNYRSRILIMSYRNNNLSKDLKQINLNGLYAMVIAHTTEKDDRFIEKNNRSFQIPFVVINREFPKSSGISYVRIDEVKGGYLAANYLQSLGHKRIVCLSLRQNLSYLKERVKGYRKAIAEKKQEDLIIKCQNPKESYAAIKTFIKKDSATAIFTTGEELLPGIMSAVKDTGKKVPKDISIVAYDDYGFSLSQTPQITTIRLPAREIGYLTGQFLYSSVKIEEQAIYHITLMPKLIERNSCRQI